MYIRDMMQISTVLDYLGVVAKPLYITDVQVPSQNPDFSRADLHDGKGAGVRHEQWDEARQGRWIEQFYKIALSKPYVDVVTYSDLTDTADSAVPNSGLLTEKLEPKKSFRALKKLHNTIFSH